MNEPQTLGDAQNAEMTIWVFCLYCGGAHLMAPHALRSKVIDGDDRLVAVAEAMEACFRCKRHGTKLIPTPRTTITFDKIMGLYGT